MIVMHVIVCAQLLGLGMVLMDLMEVTMGLGSCSWERWLNDAKE